MKFVKKTALWFFFVYYYTFMVTKTLYNIFQRVLNVFIGIKHHGNISPFKVVHPQVFAQAHQVASQNGYCFSTYHFQTADQAAVTMWRIHKQNCQFKHPHPIMLMHGLLDCSISWFMHSDKNKTLPYMLASEGYDVWLGNNRGNRISEEGSGKVEREYCLDHLVEYDQPALINKILSETRKKKLVYIGHSQGSTQFLLGIGVNSYMTDKIAAFVGLGTVLSMEHLTSHPILELLDKFYLLQLAEFTGFKRILRVPRALTQAAAAMMYNCKIHCGLISKLVQLLCGPSKNVPDHHLGAIIAQEPGGASSSNTLQWVQCYRSGKMRRLCYGKTKNKILYGSEEAPLYCLNHLQNLPFQSHIFRGLQDYVISDGDFKKMMKRFRPGQGKSYELPHYNHLDYLWGENAYKDVYQRILHIVSESSGQHPANSN